VSVGHFLSFLFIALFVFVGIFIVATYVRNRNLPVRSEITEYLSAAEKAYIAEVFHLRNALGDSVWPGWSRSDNPIIVYNEAYAFLIGYDGEPSEGWIRPPRNEHYGEAWSVVPGDDFYGEPYYRQPLTRSGPTPENFAVRVGDQWAATMQTREYSAIAFYKGFREELPSFVKPIFPYRAVWHSLMGSADTYIEGLAHESFHAYQATEVPERLYAAEGVHGLESSYPWHRDDLETAWKIELDLLYQATQAGTDTEMRDLVAQFLDQRRARRASSGMSSAMVVYERQREWLEGLAKYAELRLGLTACRDEEYRPVDDVLQDRDFKAYRTQERFWSLQLKQARQARTGETRFYYSGLAQAVLLDHLMPDWKDHAFAEDTWLDVLLEESLAIHD